MTTTTTTATEPLPECLPCPFCGGKAIAYFDMEDNIACCINQDCPALPASVGNKTLQEAIGKWNTRTRPEGSFTKADLFHAMDLVRSSGSTHTNHEIFGWMNGVTISERAPQQREG